MRAAALVLAGLLAGCGGGTKPAPVAQDLESAAIERGLVRDPADRSPVGLFARDTDRVCVVATGGGFRVGATVDYGDGIACSGAGPATRSGNSLRIALSDTCRVTARFDGDRIAFPASLADGCAALCSRRASLAALSVVRLSESASEASAMRDTRGRLLCSSR